MFVLFVLCDLINSAASLYSVSSHYARKSLLHTTQFDKPIRTLHPTLNLVAGQEFIAHVNNHGEITKRRDFPVDSSTQETCLKTYTSITCNNYATSIIQLANNTLYYCFSNSRGPISRSGTMDLVTNHDWGLSKTCLYDPSRESHILKHGSDILYVVSDSKQVNTGTFYSINTTSLKTVVPKPGYTSSIEAYKAIFKRQDYVYAIYVTTSATSQITRTCLADQGHGQTLFSTFTLATLHCKSGSTTFTKVIKAEYDSTQDLLFVLFSRDPREHSADILCAFNLTFVDNTFDTGTYTYYDKTGKESSKVGTKIDCTKARTTVPEKNMIKCVTTISSSVVLLTKLVNYDTMTLYRVGQRLLFYLTTGEQLQIWRYKDQIADLIQTVDLWSSVSNLKIYQNPANSSNSAASLYVAASGTQTFTGYPFWCNFYKEDPVKCLAIQHPACSYSTARHECIPKYQCGTTDCFQSLDNGSFSTAFPNGHNFTIRGAVCNGSVYNVNDTFYSYNSKGVLTITRSIRKCGGSTPAPPQPTTNTKNWSSRETGLLIALIGAIVVLIGMSLKLLMKNRTFRRVNSTLSPCTNVYKANGEAVQYSITGKIVNLMKGKKSNPDTVVIHNPSVSG